VLTALTGMAPSLKPPQAIDQCLVSDLHRFGEREPPNLLALSRRWCRIFVASVEQVAKIEVKVRSGRMRVQVEQHRTAGGVAYYQPGLLGRFPQRRFPRSLAQVDVPTGLHPAADALVPVQHCAASPGDDGRPGDVDRVVIPAERVGQAVQLGQEPGARSNLALGVCIECDHCLAQFSHDLVTPLASIPVHVSHHARYRRVRVKAIGEDCWVRRTTTTAVGAALIAARVSACSASTAAPATTVPLAGAVRSASSAPPASSDACYAFAVSALVRRVVVRQRPQACAGLPQAQVNQDVARAIRTVVGPHPKAVARRLAAADSRYLANLVQPVRAPPAVGVSVAAPASSADIALRFSALAAWLATAVAGAYLLAGWLSRDRRRRRIRTPGAPPVIPLSHAGLAIAGLVIWIAFTVTTVAALAWADVGLTWVIAGLGMATLLAGPDQQPSSGSASAASGEQSGMPVAPFPSRAPVIIIALHGALATLTILLVLLAAVGIG
jgi:hypothetical protein